MFNEPNFNNKNDFGWIEIICGCMFSGKTEELYRRLKRAKIAKQKVITFKHKLDNRFGEKISSHNKREMDCIPVEFSAEILLKSENYDVIGIDEVQFFDREIVNTLNLLANKGKRVIAAGLDMDSNGKPFGPVPDLLATAEFITKLHAICQVTGELASYSYRKSGGGEQVMIGERDKYEARSRSGFYG